MALAAAALALAGIVGCGPSDAPAATSPTATESANVLPKAKPSDRPIVAAVGDIACETTQAVTQTSCQQAAVGNAITKLKPDSVWLLGDIQYLNGDLDQFKGSFGKAFAPLRNRWRPVVGNHEYATPDASGYYKFFGKAAGPSQRGFYSFNLGEWHVVSLNANCDLIDCTSDSLQAKWLRNDLKKNPSRCTAALWHQPLFSSGKEHGNDPLVRPLWRILQNHHADLVLNGHDHDFETFARQDSYGKADPNGMIEIVAGLGGRSFYDFGKIQPNSKVRISDSFGFLKLRLNARSFDWSFVNKDSKVLARSSARCV
jgi:hypothetical protein